MWTSEHLNKIASEHLHCNSNVKDKPNLAVSQVCHWVNNDLLPNETHTVHIT